MTPKISPNEKKKSPGWSGGLGPEKKWQAEVAERLDGVCESRDLLLKC